MQRIFTFIFLLVLAAGITITADDVLVLQNGDIINGIVTEVTTSEVKYKKASNPNGPIYSVEKNEVLSIKYENGEIDKFDKRDNFEGIQPISASLENDSLLTVYNVFYSPNLNKLNANKTTKNIFYVLHVDNKSILSNQDIEIELNKNMDYEKNGGHKANDGDTYVNDCLGDRPNPWGWFDDQGVYQIIMKNKTSSTIYVDLGNSFRVENGSPLCFYDGSEIRTLSSSNSNSFGLGLGAITNTLGIGGAIGTIANGMSVGTQSGNGASTTYIKERIFILPPFSSRVLNEPRWIKIHGRTFFSHGKYENVGGHYEYPTDNFIFLKDKPYEGQITTYDISNSPFIRQYYFTYSTDGNFRTFCVLNFNLFLAQIIGVKKTWESIINPNEHTIGGIVNYRFKY